MATPSPSPGPVAQDGFYRYYAEKLWAWIPETYRHEDGLADPPHILRGLVEVLAFQAAHARRTSDRLWEDLFIEFADDWAVPYLGRLVGTRLLGSLNRRGRRVDVAKTIFYRRRKGTPVVMETLIQDITGWEGAVVEAFQRLARARHRLDPEPVGWAGPITTTPPGGTANLRHGRLSEILDGPFDDLAHTTDVRRLEGFQGRYNIPKLNFFLYRIPAFEVVLATPFDLGNRRYTFDPSGREAPLFRPSQRIATLTWTPVEEWQLPAPIPCRLLDTFASQLIPRAVALTLATAEQADPLPSGALQAGNLAEWDLPAAPGIEGFVDPVRGRFLLANPLPPGQTVFVPRYHYGCPGEIGAGTYDRSASVAHDGVTEFDPAENNPGPVTGFLFPTDGIHQFANSKTYRPAAPAANTVDNIGELSLQAADRTRPYVTLVPGGGGSEWIFRAPPGEGHTLTLDGLWIGMRHDDETGVCPDTLTLVIDGEFDSVVIRHCTLDPGGTRAESDPGACATIPAVTLELRGQVRELLVESSILGPIREATSTTDPCSAGRILIRDSIVQRRLGGSPAIETRVADLILERVTVFGDVQVNRLEATEALIQGTVIVLDNQHGCFRFSTAHDTPDARLPRRFESSLFAPRIPNHVFTSRTFGHPGFAQLSATAPANLARGAENRGEIGAYNRLLNPIKLDDLETKVLEFMPFGLIPQFILES